MTRYFSNIPDNQFVKGVNLRNNNNLSLNIENPEEIILLQPYSLLTYSYPSFIPNLLYTGTLNTNLVCEVNQRREIMVFSVTFKQEQYLTYTLSDSEALSQITVVPERGGIILLWKINGQDIFYLDKERFSNPEMSIRGGVPILFPICGNIQDNTYTYLNKTYTLKQHGFARDLPWEITKQGTENCASLTVTLKSNEQTRAVYPFEFQLDFTYELKGNSLIIRQKYTNNSEIKMPFSFGFHPYYYVPDKSKVIFDIPSSEYQDQATKEIFSYDGTFDFNEDEIDVGFQSLTRSLATMTDNHRKLKLVLSWSDVYSTFVFWTLKGKDYVCLEPWSAPRNSLNTRKNLTALDPGATCEAIFGMNVESIWMIF